MKKRIKDILKAFLWICKEKEMIPVSQPINVDKILDGKVALITGGSGGIGLAIAKSFIDSGCKVILAGTNENKLKSAVDSLEEREKSKYIILNVLDITQIPNKVQEAAEKFGGSRIDILVNSAGVVSHSDFFEMSEEEYDTVMDINTKGTFFMGQAVSKYMIEKNIKGHILNISSASALRPAWTPYQISKWAVRGLTLGMADMLLPYGIVVNAIGPGPVATPMLNKQAGDSIYSATNPSGRFALPSEIASLATFMVSDMGNLIVGDTFYMTGGSGTISLHN